MEHTHDRLSQKIIQMYPEIRDQGISMGLTYDELDGSWLVKLSKGDKELTSYLRKEDAEECLSDGKCERFGIELGEFVRSLEKAH